MKALNLVIELSDLFEQADAEGGLVAQLIDAEIMPVVRAGLTEADAIGLGDRFNRVIEKVRMSANRTGKDRIRTLKDMLKSALATYVRNTNDAMTARGVFHRSIKGGSDIMLSVAAATILANALCGNHSKEAQTLMQRVAGKLTGRQPIPAMENASGAATGAGSIATVADKKKKLLRRNDSIFAEGDVIAFPGKLKPNPQNLYARISQRLRPFAQARQMAEELGWKQTGHQQIPDSTFIASLHRDPSGSGYPLWIVSNGAWQHMGTNGHGPETLHEYLKQHTVMGEALIEGDVIAFPGAKRPVHNPELSQADDVSNLYMMRPQTKPMSNRFFVILFTPHDGEQEDYADLAEIKNVARHFNLTKYDRTNHMFYAPGHSAANVATLHVYHEDKTELTPVETARINTEVQQFLQSQPSQMESLHWDDLLGKPTVMEVLREVAYSGTPRRHDGVIVDPTTAELVLCVHRSLTQQNQQRYETKSLSKMIAIAERAVQRGLIGVSMEEA